MDDVKGCSKMKLSEIKKNADAKAAEEEAARKHVQLMKDLEVHPLLKWGCERDVRDAYFCGVVFAAMTDDAQIDERERKAILRIGHSLEFSQEEIDEIVETVSRSVKNAIDAGGGDVFVLLEESAAALKDEKVYRLFVSEYVKVCAVKEFDAKDVELQLQEHVATKLGRNINQFVFDPIEHAVVCGEQIVPSELLALSDWLGEETTRYFMLDRCGDVLGVISKERETVKKLKEKKEREEKEIATRDRMRAEFDAWLNGIADKYCDMKKIPEGVPSLLCRQADRFDASKLDLSGIKQRIVAGCTTSKVRMAWKLLGYFALRFRLTDTSMQTRSAEYLMKTCFGRDSSIWGSGFSGKSVAQAFKDCIAKYNA